MVIFPNAKINLGLEILKKRDDGYHEIDSVFCPVPLCDAMELVPEKNSKEDSWHFSGLPIPGNRDENLCAKALVLLRQKREVPPLSVYLHKAIPMGAGLGGGSADGAFFLRCVNDLCSLGLDKKELAEMALELGSDCPFFIANEVSRATGRGEILRPIEVDLKGKTLVLVSPKIHVSTAEAYRSMVPDDSHSSPWETVALPMSEWKGKLRNRFEEHAFSVHPELGVIKDELHSAGAAYASMTGSGSTVFGIFDSEPADHRFRKFGKVFSCRF